MLTTTLDGLWVLQVLAGIEVLSPEVGLRPHLPSCETRSMALDHPVAAELRAVGAITDEAAVDPAVLDWLTVLSRREVALMLLFGTPGAQVGPRVLLARFAQWWVVLERSGSVVSLTGVGTATTEHCAAELINTQIDRLCGDVAPARLQPVTLDAAELVSGIRGSRGLRTLLADCGLDGGQINTLMSAADTECSARISIVAIQSGVAGAPARTFVDSGAVTIIDTPQGRLLCEHIVREGRSWMIVAPGTAGGIAAAVAQLVRRLPADNDWYSQRRAV